MMRRTEDVEATGADERPLATGMFALIAVASFGGPLAIGGLYGPQIVDDVTGAAGWVALAAIVAFAGAIAIWLRFSRDYTGPAGLSGFVQVALGPRAARLHAAVWTGSYLLYLLYTSAYVVDELLPIPVPSVVSARNWLLVLAPVAVACLLVAGRTAVVSVVALFAIGQVVLLGIADATAVVNAPAAHGFGANATGNDVVRSIGMTSALFVCGSLPLFFGGDIRRAAPTVRRTLPVAFVLAGLLLLLALYPYARHPAYTHSAMPAYTVVDNEASHPLAVAVGLGIASSVVAVMLIEGLALTRLVAAMTALSRRTVARCLALALVVAGPISLIDADGFYDDLLRPSLILLWLAQLGVIVAFVVHASRRRELARWLPAVAVTGAVFGYALYLAARGGGST